MFVVEMRRPPPSPDRRRWRCVVILVILVILVIWWWWRCGGSLCFHPSPLRPLRSLRSLRHLRRSCCRFLETRHPRHVRLHPPLFLYHSRPMFLVLAHRHILLSQVYHVGLAQVPHTLLHPEPSERPVLILVQHWILNHLNASLLLIILVLLAQYPTPELAQYDVPVRQLIFPPPNFPIKLSSLQP